MSSSEESNLIRTLQNAGTEAARRGRPEPYSQSEIANADSVTAARYSVENTAYWKEWERIRAGR